MIDEHYISKDNPDYIDWILCEDCGCKVYSRFKDHKKCMVCLADIHQEIENKLNTSYKLIYKTKIDYNKYLNK